MQSVSVKKALAAGAAAVMLAVVAIGVAAAQAAPSPEPPAAQGERGGRHEQFLAALANRLHVSTDQLRQAIADARQDAGLPQGEPFGGDHHAGRFGPGGRFLRQELGAVASLLGISPEQLRQELPGKSLADVAAAHGKTAADVVQVITDTADQKIDQAVEAGRLSADRAAQLKTKLAERVEQVVTHQFPTRSPES